MGSMLEFASLWRLGQRYPHIDLSLLHLGGTRVLGILVGTLTSTSIVASE